MKKILIAILLLVCSVFSVDAGSIIIHDADPYISERCVWMSENVKGNQISVKYEIDRGILIFCYNETRLVFDNLEVNTAQKNFIIVIAMGADGKTACGWVFNLKDNECFITMEKDE